MLKKNKNEIIKKIAKDIGFDLVGIAKIKELPYSNYLREWIKMGYDADMKWIERSIEKRLDIQKIYSGIKSVIVVAENYYEIKSDNYYACISRYANKKDYHHRIEKKLKKLIDRIKELEKRFWYRIYVDTGPIMEKLWAIEAGIGWMGKHSNIINRELGSWFCLGVLLIDIELEADQREKDYCGKCTKCIEACPTSAIVQPYVIDARRCISYLTIENKGEINSEFIPKLKGNFFGCDICQEVCPWNKFAKISKLEPKLPIVYNKEEIASLLKMKREDFIKTYEGYPIRRVKYEGFIRNLKAIYNS